MHKSKFISLIIIITSLLYLGCSETVTPPPEPNSIQIEFPIGKTAIYANGVYEGDSIDSLQLLGLNVFSLQFDSIITKSNGIEYIGNIGFYTISHGGNDSLDNEFYTEPVKIVVSVDDDWVLFQYSENYNSGLIFLKRNLLVSDTTIIPTFYNNQFPVFPSEIFPNRNYSVFRPKDDSIRFLGVQRNFDVRDYSKWNDIYGDAEGLYYSTEHILHINDDFTLYFRGIIDSKGVLISSYSKEMELFSAESPVPSDTVTVHQINRRIVDFTEPENIKELSWYSDYVLENGLSILEEQ